MQSMAHDPVSRHIRSERKPPCKRHTLTIGEATFDVADDPVAADAPAGPVGVKEPAVGRMTNAGAATLNFVDVGVAGLAESPVAAAGAADVASAGAGLAGVDCFAARAATRSLKLGIALSAYGEAFFGVAAGEAGWARETVAGCIEAVLPCACSVAG